MERRSCGLGLIKKMARVVYTQKYPVEKRGAGLRVQLNRFVGESGRGLPQSKTWQNDQGSTRLWTAPCLRRVRRRWPACSSSASRRISPVSAFIVIE
jgi:hypothetical protein